MAKNTGKIYFSPNINNRERACFEAGIKLGALYHILSGMPISSDPTIIKSIERGIEASISCQPFVQSVEIKLDNEKIAGKKLTHFDYDEINGTLIRAKVVIEYEDIKVVAKIQWVEEFQYPLMFIENITLKE